MLKLTGQRFGRLVAIRPTDERRRTSIVWECQCDCGQLCRVPSDWLRSGVKRSCGCLQDASRRGDITGQHRGHLTAIQPTDQRRNGATVWEWRCDCGATVYKAVDLVRDTASTMCPACAKRLKGEQADAMRERVPRDAETNIMPGELQNLRQGKLHRNNTSGVRGVSFHTGTQKWVARMQDGGRTISLGYYSTIEEAAKARAEAVKKKYGVDEKKQP